MKIFAVTLSLLTCMVGFCARPIFAQDFSVVQPQKLISVAGEAEVKVVPDEVILTLGLTTSGADLAKVKKLNNERVKNLFAAAVALKIEPKNIQTDFIRIDPDYWGEGPKFTVSRTVAITLKDISKYDDVLTRLVQNNRANSLEGIEFRTSKLRKYRDQARAMAARAAREKANALAAALGVKAGKPVSIREDDDTWSYWGGRSSVMMNAQVNAESRMVNVSPSATLLPGQISVSARVAVSFELIQP